MLVLKNLSHVGRKRVLPHSRRDVQGEIFEGNYGLYLELLMIYCLLYGNQKEKCTSGQKAKCNNDYSIVVITIIITIIVTATTKVTKYSSNPSNVLSTLHILYYLIVKITKQYWLLLTSFYSSGHRHTVFNQYTRVTPLVNSIWGADIVYKA